jgi:NAD(P)-dependent dehydrogenase (short-subunit alcohol dehydrogenase family)
MSSLAGAHVVITGGAGALGGAVVAAFVEAGAHCHLPILESGAPPAPQGVTATAGVDLTSDAQVAAYYATLPPIVASVHLAGGYAGSPILETSRELLDRQIELNLVTTFLCCREAIRALRKGRAGGRIVNVGSRVSEVPAGGSAAYTAAKAAVAALTRSLAAELRGEGILVNAVLPSVIDTPANRAAMPKADHAKWPKPADLARTILWLASPDNRLTSGALIPVYGES